MRRLCAKLCIFTLTLFSIPAFATNDLNCAHSYGLRADVNGVIGETFCSPNSQTVIDIVENFEVSNSSYTETSAAQVVGRFNDVDFTLSYTNNSNTLSVSIAELGIENKTFTGNTRDESQDQFTDWLKKSGIIGAIMKYQAQNSATSSITGVGGVIPNVAQTDFNSEFNAVSKTTASTNQNILGLEMGLGSYSIKNRDERVETATLPLSYSFDVNQGSGQKLIMSMPLTMYKIGNAKGYHAGVGMAYRFPVNDKWTLTPSVRYSLTGSADRATIASVMSGSLMSTYTVPVGQFDLSVGNMLGYYRTGKFKAGDYSFDPKIKQTMIKNGVMLSQPIQLKNKKLAVEYSIIDTRYIGGEKPFLSNMQEFGLTVGLHKDAAKSKWASLRGGITYTRAKQANGLTMNVGYWF